jgi:hypothetical protein
MRQNPIGNDGFGLAKRRCRAAAQWPPGSIQMLSVQGAALPFRIVQDPTLASSSLFSTFTILNCSACMPVSARNESLPK